MFISKVIDGCTLESLQDRLEKGNLPKKEIERTKKANEKEFPDGIPECGSDALRFGLLAYTVSNSRTNEDCIEAPSNIFCLRFKDATLVWTCLVLSVIACFAINSGTQ
jgi:valyl-tRNA synthetase